jgi:mannose-6-phosphate isomerase
MDNPIQHYDWGSTHAIQELIGRKDLIGRPCAELWMGAHPRASSVLIGNEGSVPLVAEIEADPTSLVGAAVYEQYGATLPFLFKVLAAERALSIQAHPRKDQAAAGFERENALGVPLDARHRNYRDRNHKPELMCAVSEFHALRGFRPIPEIVADMEIIPELHPPARELAAAPNAEGLAAFFRTLMTLPDATRRAAISSAVAHAGGISETAGDHTGAQGTEGAQGAGSWAWVRRLWEQYGEDVGVLAPLYLNTVRLQPGEALFLPAQTLHAYLSGVGIEIMANSDNVLRGGLTSKHVDVPELLSSLAFDAGRPSILTPRDTGDGCRRRFDTEAAEFELERIDLRGTEPCMLPATAGPRIIFALKGEAMVETEHRTRPNTETSCAVRGGASLFAAAGHGGITLSGEGTIFVAGVPV